MERENKDTRITVIPWIDLSCALQSRILQDISNSFGKPVTDPLRFFRPSCLVWFYRESSSLNGDAIAITFRIGDAHYLDKFFVITKKNGIGRRFLAEWIESLDSRLIRPVRWRTDETLAQKFYGKHPAVWTIAHHGEYVYQGIRQTVLDTEEMVSLLRIPSAFSDSPPNSSV